MVSAGLTIPVTVMPKLPAANSVLSGAGALRVGKENPEIGVEEVGSPDDWLEFNMRAINFSQAL